MELMPPLAPGLVRYERHRPETTLLYQLVERHYPDFLVALAERGGQVRVIACLEDPLVIGKILAHLETRRRVRAGEGRRPEVRGPPPGTLKLR